MTNQIAVITIGVLLVTMGTIIVSTTAANAQVNGTNSSLSNALLKGLGVGGKQCAFNSSFGKSAILGPLGVQYRNNTSGCNLCFTHGVGYGILMEKLLNKKLQQAISAHNVTQAVGEQRLMMYEKTVFCK